MGARRMRGWGGVAAMAVACALTATGALLLPLDSTVPPVGRTGGGITGARQAEAPAAEDCDRPQASLRPTGALKDGDALKAIRKRGKLVVGVDQNSYLWSYRDPQDPALLKGFDIDLAKEIGRRVLGSEQDVVFRTIRTDQRVSAIRDGEVDMVVRTMTISCERAEDVAFSTAYFRTGQQVLAPRTSGITGFDNSLRGKRLCYANGSSAEDALKKNSYGADIKTSVPNQLDCLVRLQLGQVDAVVTDDALAAGQAAQDPTVELKGEPLGTTEYYGVAMEKHADDLVKRVNAILEDYRASGWQKSYDKWLKPVMGASDGPPPAEYR